MPSTPEYPDAAEFTEIGGLTDPVIRNLRVTWGYHELANAIAARTGPWTNWCALATWASKQAGRTIRSEDLDAAAARVIADLLEARVAHAVIEVLRSLKARADVTAIRAALRSRLGIDRVLRRSSDAISRGNTKVFMEIGRDLSSFLAVMDSDGPLDEAAVERFCETLPPGDPPSGKGFLRLAILHLHRSMMQADPADGAQWQLLSNLEIGYHEQVRLQGEITEAIDAPLPDAEALVAGLLADVFPAAGVLVRLRNRLRRVLGGPTPLDRAAAELIREARSRLHRLLTEHIMTIELPGVVLRLGGDIPGTFPPSVARIDNTELLALLRRLDPTLDSTAGSAAVDWSDLDERMHYIVDLFRAWHEAPELLRAPYTTEQVAAIRAGRLPAGRL